jgi:hypothetical protein
VTSGGYQTAGYDCRCLLPAFDARHADQAARLARAVTEHATPPGSGTAARTKRVDVGRRAEAAVITWLRHQMTIYDGMTIPRVKGQRREVRRFSARRSRRLLDAYRRGDPVDADRCPLSPGALPPVRREQSRAGRVRESGTAVFVPISVWPALSVSARQAKFASWYPSRRSPE